MIIGIDPGLTGGIAWENSVVLMPVKEHHAAGDIIDVSFLQSLFITIKPALVVIERQQTRFAKGALRNGMNFGMIVALCELMDIKFTLANPNEWQKVILPDKKMTRDERKFHAIEIAQNNGFIIPTLRPTGKKLHDGCADAACIWLWAQKRELNGEVMNVSYISKKVVIT